MSVELGLKHERGCKQSKLVNESKYAGTKCRHELLNYSFDDDEKKVTLDFIYRFYDLCAHYVPMNLKILIDIRKSINCNKVKAALYVFNHSSPIIFHKLTL